MTDVELELIGWRACFRDAISAHALQGNIPGRVVAQDRGVQRLVTQRGEIAASVAAGLRRNAMDRTALPAVGDWVAVQPAGDGWSIVAVLPRETAFVRKAAGNRAEPQVVAANVDTVFLVTGLDGDFNIRRIERYVAVARASGARPVIVLNKADVCDDLEGVVASVRSRSGGAQTVAMSAREDDPVALLAPWLVAGETVALIGSSGVGKSTIANRLLGSEALKTGAVREHDQRGVHTTTRRELVVLPGGALLIDTPGMRELSVWSDEEGIRAAFDDVAEVASGCRFSDCRHEGEPGCAVVEAIADGRMDADRFANFRALEKEAAFLETRRDANAQLAQKRKWKAIHKAMRNVDKRK
ncbi:MAG: ribosome small subunit-dependent GTPase A [Acidobacteria bacterium]|nr:ribosome small subunit-dependent GTPase A [Acidobacteriota bacterium]